MKALLRFFFSVVIFYTLVITGCSDPNSPKNPDPQNQNLFKPAPVIENLTSDLSLTGSGFISAGTGLISQPGLIQITVPNVTITKVLLYWEMRDPDVVLGDNQIRLNGTTSVIGELIGGPTLTLTNRSFTYRADITGLGIIIPNTSNNIFVDELSSARPDGASIVVVYNDGTDAFLEMRDGNDFAYIHAIPGDPDKINTVPQIFTFASAIVNRVASLTLIVGDVAKIGDVVRPNSLQYTVAGTTTTILDPFSNSDGLQWDTEVLNINIPAGETQLTIQLFSGPEYPGSPDAASLVWVAAGLSVPIPDDGEGCTLTPGYWKTHSALGPAPFNNTWNLLPVAHNTVFFSSGKTYYEAFWTSPSGNAYYILAHAYMAAKLNQLAGTSIPASVLNAFNTATGLFNTYTPAQIGVMKGSNPVRQQFVSLAGILDDYNNGITGPGHCPD